MQDSLHVIRSEIGNQCSALRSGLVWSCREDLRINLADAFWIFWSIYNEQKKDWLVAYLILLPHIPALFMTSLTLPATKWQLSRSCFRDFQTLIDI